MEVAEAFLLISRAIDADMAANGYLICGDMAECHALTNRILHKLFADELPLIENRAHPDVAYLEPEGAKRIIKVDSMRDRIVVPMSATSFSGGWKVGVIEGADRMEGPSANAFLKSLEEPPPKTLYLLLTDTPDAILPTIVSRSQRIDLPPSSGVLDGIEYDAIAEVMNARGIVSVFQKCQIGRRLAEIMGELKESDGDMSILRKRFFRTLIFFARGWLVDNLVSAHLAMRNIEAIEEAYVQSAERSMSDDMVLSFLCDRMTWPAA